MNKKNRTILDNKETKKIKIHISIVKEFIYRLKNEQKRLLEIDPKNDEDFDLPIERYNDKLFILELQLKDKVKTNDSNK